MKWEIEISDNLIWIKFNSFNDLLDIIIPIDYFLNDTGCHFERVLLISYKNGIKWTNDITKYTKSDLVLLYLKLKTTNLAENDLNSYIEESDLNMDTEIKIYTLNKINKVPNFDDKLFWDRKIFKKKIIKKWLKNF